MLIFDQLRKNDRRLQTLAICVLSGLSILLLGLWYVQVVLAKRYQASQVSQSFRTVRIPAIRGKILDANGTTLAENHPDYNVNLYLEELRPYFQSHYSNTLNWVTKELGKAGGKTKLSRAQRIELGKQTRFQVVSNLVARVTNSLGVPFPLNEKQFLEHYDQRLFIPMPVFSSLTPPQIARFVEQSGNLPGFDLDVQPTRIYPHHSTAAHLLGYLQREDAPMDEDTFFNYRLPDFTGATGIERAFDESLRGKTGIKTVLVNSLGYRQSENVWSPAEPGQNVYLTIDLTIQKAAEQALHSGPEGTHTRGAVVVMDPTNGDLLAVASSPTFDPNQFIQGLSHDELQSLNDYKLRPQINRATAGVYAPGSIFKTVVAMAALEAGLNPKEKIYNPPDPSEPWHGHIFVGRRKVKDLAPPGDYDFQRALIKSSNTYFITNGLKAGVDRILELGKRLHFGERTGIPTRQDSGGTFPTREWQQANLGGAWFDGNTANLCIGQGEIAVTPLQVAVLISAIANGGKVFWPRLVSRVEPQDPFSNYQPVEYPTAHVRDNLNVSRRSLDLIREAMHSDVHDADGTGRRAFVPGMHICAKTGTAQIMQGRKIVGHTVWFASFAPYENPRYTMVVMVELDEGIGGSGSETCAPLAHQVYLALQKHEQQAKPNKPGALAKN
jgi:penicillin-binding protein 2